MIKPTAATGERGTPWSVPVSKGGHTYPLSEAHPMRPSNGSSSGRLGRTDP